MVQSPPPTPPLPPAAAQPPLLDLEQVYRLITDRASGRVSNEQVEQAVSQLLQQQQQALPQPSSQPATSRKRPLPDSPHNENITVQQDMGNYDNDNEEEQDTTTKQTKQQKLQQETGTTPSFQMSNNNNNKIDPKLYQDIPLGVQGARMVLAFGGGGDNNHNNNAPRPDTVAAVLKGARRMLLVAMQDARHLRRTMTINMQHAKAAVLQHAKRNKRQVPLLSEREQVHAHHEHVPSWVLYRVQQAARNDPTVNVTPPCGFGIQDLTALFPEEMNAFERWNQMKEEADDRGNDGDSGEGDDGDEKDKESAGQKGDSQAERPETKGNNNKALEATGGHLQERAQQFDYRTAQMKKDSYIQFSNVRYQGSFLPRNSATTTHSQQWHEHQQQQPPHRGRRRAGGWAHKSFIEVRFLHWIGFDPTNSNDDGSEGHSLTPPSTETTEVLGFLGHDFVGRIVETALAIRRDEESQNDSKLPSNAGRVPLTPQDIARAMEHPDIKPIPIYGTRGESGTGVGTQLYFGPGFEDRVEMELEEMVQQQQQQHKGSHADDDTQQQQQQHYEWRIKENLLFEHLAAQAPASEEELLQKTTGGESPKKKKEKSKETIEENTSLLSSEVEGASTTARDDKGPENDKRNPNNDTAPSSDALKAVRRVAV